MTDNGDQRIPWQSCVIVGIVQRTPTIKSFFLRLSRSFVHIAGQHVDVKLTAPDGYSAMRSYSIASSANASSIIEIAIELLPDGEVSSFFHDVAAVGDEIELRGPLGGHFLWPEPAAGTVLLAGPLAKIFVGYDAGLLALLPAPSKLVEHARSPQPLMQPLPRIAPTIPGATW